MIFETKSKKKFRKKTDRLGNIYLDSLWQSIDMDDIVLPSSDHQQMTSHIFKKQANLFIRRLFCAGAFTNFPLDQQQNAKHGWAPKGYEVVLKLPLNCGGNYHISNFILMPKGYEVILYDLYYRQIANEIEQLHPGSKNKIYISIPHLPDFITNETFQNYLYPEDRKLVSDFLKKQKLMRQLSSQKVEKIEKGQDIIFRLRKNPNLNFSYELRTVPVSIPSLIEREELARQYSHQKESLLIQAIRRGDFNKLDKKEKEYLLKKHRLPTELKLTCHHILPRSLGGKNDINNLVWMSEEDHKILHQEILNHLVSAVMTQLENDKKKSVHLVIPYPIVTEEKEVVKITSVSKKKLSKLYARRRKNRCAKY